MTMQQLQADLAEVKKALPAGALIAGEDLVAYLKNNLIPFIEAHVAETAEIDEAVANLVEHEADILHEETSAVFSSLIVSGLAVAKELAARAGNDQRLHQLIKEFRDLAEQAQEVLSEVTVPDDEEQPEEQPEDAPGASVATEGPSQ